MIKSSLFNISLKIGFLIVHIQERKSLDKFHEAKAVQHTCVEFMSLDAKGNVKKGNG
jgi:hypothetical protein